MLDLIKSALSWKLQPPEQRDVVVPPRMMTCPTVPEGNEDASHETNDDVNGTKLDPTPRRTTVSCPLQKSPWVYELPMMTTRVDRSV